MVKIPNMSAKNNIQVSLTLQKPQLSSGKWGADPGVNCHTGALCRHYLCLRKLPCADCSNTKQHQASARGQGYATSCGYQVSTLAPYCDSHCEDITRSLPSMGLSSDSYWSQYKTGNLLATKQIRKCNILDNWFTSYLPHRLLFVSKEKGIKCMLSQDGRTLCGLLR